MSEIDRIFATHKVYKVGSPEYEALMAKWSKEAYADEISAARDSYLEHEDAMGRLPKIQAHKS